MTAPGWAKRVPASASIRPAAIFRSVDLPEPLPPPRHSRSPAATLSSAPSRRRVPPKATVMSFRCKSGAMAPLFAVPSRRDQVRKLRPRLGGDHDAGARHHLDGGFGPVGQGFAIKIQHPDIAFDRTLHQQALAVRAPHPPLAGMADLAIGDMDQLAALALEDHQL